MNAFAVALNDQVSVLLKRVSFNDFDKSKSRATPKRKPLLHYIGDWIKKVSLLQSEKDWSFIFYKFRWLFGKFIQKAIINITAMLFKHSPILYSKLNNCNLQH